MDYALDLERRRAKILSQLTILAQKMSATFDILPQSLAVPSHYFFVRLGTAAREPAIA